jgi:DNA invertase Pin-like site-specific DNA recombinase
MNAAAYIYASLERKDLDTQLGEIRRYAAVRGWEVVATYADATSGARDGRTDFRRLLADAASGKFDAVIIPAFDHLARSVRQLAETLEQLRRCGVALVSVTDRIDTTGPGGEQIFDVMTAIRRFERALTGERIRTGLRKARAAGTRVGRPRALVDREQVLALRAAGFSYPAIGRRLGVSTALVHHLAQHPCP